MTIEKWTKAERRNYVADRLAAALSVRIRVYPWGVGIPDGGMVELVKLLDGIPMVPGNPTTSDPRLLPPPPEPYEPGGAKPETAEDIIPSAATHGKWAE